MAELQAILKQYWGFDSFRPFQEDIIRSVLNNHDTLALMPTGGGKSLCYQVPAMAREGLCLVISPLIALMKDQVEGLRKKNITALSIYSGMTRKEVINTLKVASDSNCKFLFVSPERLETQLFKEYLPGLPINLVAVDEAHCISQWGYDFRPPYLRIAALRAELPGIPVLALTASATPAVQKDICDKLDYRPEDRTTRSKTDESFPWNIFRQPFERPNLSYSVFRVDSKINKITDILKNVPGTSVIYCKSRRRAREISELLALQGIQADFYHAGLPAGDRSRKQEQWIQSLTRVIVCTNAFGMGIDKPDVRTVIHADTPDCLENYYQEAGRAGRDGRTAYAVLLYDDRDIREIEGTASLRFPTLQEIRDIYQAVANYLQVPSGTGAYQYYDFDFTDFLKKFNRPAHTSLYALKALEQESWLSFNEQVFVSPTIVFTTDKDYLYAFEQEHPAYESLLKTLLRTYEGIFNNRVQVSEKLLSNLLAKPVDEIVQQLQFLHRSGVLDYAPQKDSPQILLLRDRVRAEELDINMVSYLQRKEQFELRTKQMLGYIKETAECRGRILGSYFGDATVRACGICDNCLKQKATTISPEEFDALHHRIVNMVKYESLHTRDLLLKLNRVKKEKAWKVLEFLQAENKIEMDSSGKVRLKSH